MVENLSQKQQDIIYISLTRNDLNSFCKCLIKTTSYDAFNSGKIVIAQFFKKRQRGFALVVNAQALSNLRKEGNLVERVLTISEINLSKFLVTCPSCTFRQVRVGNLSTCHYCNAKYQSPGST